MFISILEPILTSYIELVARLLRRLHIRVEGGGISIELGPEQTPSIDERIAKIESARSNLLEGIRAIDELRETAEVNKREASDALAQIASLQRNKIELERELESVRTVIESDIETFRTMAGLPSAAQIRKERLIGFLSGVLASIVASGVIFGIKEVVERL